MSKKKKKPHRSKTSFDPTVVTSNLMDTPCGLKTTQIVNAGIVLFFDQDAAGQMQALARAYAEEDKKPQK